MNAIFHLTSLSSRTEYFDGGGFNMFRPAPNTLIERRILIHSMEPLTGIEPATRCLQDSRSTY